jgi:transcription termination/antitermination protein NusA
VEEIAKEKDLAKLGEVPGVGIKKARQIKSAAETYLVEEAKLRTELNAERAAHAAALGLGGTQSPGEAKA